MEEVASQAWELVAAESQARDGLCLQAVGARKVHPRCAAWPEWRQKSSMQRAKARSRQERARLVKAGTARESSNMTRKSGGSQPG